MTILEKIEQYALDDWQISIEVGHTKYNKYLTPEQRADVGMNGTHYVNLFYSDSGGPHKPGTKSGIGYGYSIEEAFNNAIKDIKLINGI